MAELELKDQIAALVASVREQNTKLDGISSEIVSVKTTVTSLEEIKPALVDLALWKPKIDQAVGALQADLGDLLLVIDHLAQMTTASSASPSAPPTASPRAPPQPQGQERRPELCVDAGRAPSSAEDVMGPLATALISRTGAQ